MGTNRITFELYDGRYLADPNTAWLHFIADSLKEAKEMAPYYGDDTVIVKTTSVPHYGHYKVVSSEVIPLNNKK